MTVIVAEHTPDKVRGLLKRWFIEPKPNVFVGSVNSRIREKVLQYLLRYSPEEMALLVIFDDINSQGFSIRRYHDTSCIERLITGHYLLAHSVQEESESSSAGNVSGSVSSEVRARFWTSYEQCFITYVPKA